jgi:hypothetical protein
MGARVETTWVLGAFLWRRGSQRVQPPPWPGVPAAVSLAKYAASASGVGGVKRSDSCCCLSSSLSEEDAIIVNSRGCVAFTVVDVLCV